MQIYNILNNSFKKLGVVTQVFNPSNWEVEVNGSMWVWSQLGLNRKFQARQGYIVTPMRSDWLGLLSAGTTRLLSTMSLVELLVFVCDVVLLCVLYMVGTWEDRGIVVGSMKSISFGWVSVLLSSVHLLIFCQVGLCTEIYSPTSIGVV